MIQRVKKSFSTLIKLCLAFSLIYWLVNSGRVNFYALNSLLSPINFGVCLSLVLISLSFVSERWRRLILTQTSAYSFFKTFKLTLIGQFFNFAMPGGVGGDVIKSYYFAKDNKGSSRALAITSVLIDRILGLYAMTIFALLVMTIDMSHVFKIPVLKTLYVFILLLFVVFSIALSLLFSDKIFTSGLLHKLLSKLPFSQKLLKLYESFHLFGKKGTTVFLSILYSLVSQFTSVLFLYFVAQVTGFKDVPFNTFLIVAPIGFMATAVPISPAGIGVGQAAFYYLFNLYSGTESSVGAVTITALQVTNFAFGLIGAVFYISRKDKVNNQTLN